MSDRRTTRPGSLGVTAQVVFFGNFVWLGWLWLCLLVVLPVALAVVGAAGGELTESVWASAGLGWQRWLLFASGVITAVTFLRLVVTRGVTRRRLAHGSILAMAALSTVGMAVGAAGFAIERALFSANDWKQGLDGVGSLQWGELPRVVVENGLLFAVYYVSGWLIGAVFVRSGVALGVLAIVPGLLPAAIVEMTVSRAAGRLNVDVLPDVVRDPALTLTLTVGLVVVAASSVVASRLTSNLPVR